MNIITRRVLRTALLSGGLLVAAATAAHAEDEPLVQIGLDAAAVDVLPGGTGSAAPVLDVRLESAGVLGEADALAVPGTTVEVLPAEGALIEVLSAEGAAVEVPAPSAEGIEVLAVDQAELGVLVSPRTGGAPAALDVTIEPASVEVLGQPGEERMDVGLGAVTAQALPGTVVEDPLADLTVQGVDAAVTGGGVVSPVADLDVQCLSLAALGSAGCGTSAANSATDATAPEPAPVAAITLQGLRSSAPASGDGGLTTEADLACLGVAVLGSPGCAPSGAVGSGPAVTAASAPTAEPLLALAPAPLGALAPRALVQRLGGVALEVGAGSPVVAGDGVTGTPAPAVVTGTASTITPVIGTASTIGSATPLMAVIAAEPGSPGPGGALAEAAAGAAPAALARTGATEPLGFLALGALLTLGGAAVRRVVHRLGSARAA